MWCYGFSKVEIQYITLNRKYISTSTLPQFLALLNIEKYSELSLSKIAELICCNIQVLKEEITGLVYNPSFNRAGNPDKGLIKGNWDKTKKEFKEDTVISFNPAFTNNAIKFTTMPIILKKTAAQQQQTELEEAQIMKKYQDNILQATLTRIMKSRIGVKTPHVWLINEAAKQIDNFKAQPAQIKENIEKLIEKNIMKRSDNDRTCYDYIA